jgi:Uma2 family endonuclease
MTTGRLPWRVPPLTKAEEDNLFMLMLEDDTEDAPWMSMGDLQFWSASSFAHSLRNYAHERGLSWYVASMLPIEYLWGGSARKHKLAPDVFVAFAPERPHSSYNVEDEGGFPPFVLEVVSPSSTERDREDKRDAYEILGVREYALFTPRVVSPSTLTGFRRNAEGQFELWLPAPGGQLWSDVLGLLLVVRGALLQAQTADGRLLLTPEQSEVERSKEVAARLQAEAEREHANQTRREAEAEIERLRRELERYRNLEG